MKIIASGDHHFDEHSTRWQECLRIHTWMAERVALERPDVFLSGGDIYERASTPAERTAVAEWLTAIAEVCPVVIAKGNHDRRLDIEWLGRIRAKHPIIAEERAAVHHVGGGAIAVMAYPNRASLALMTGTLPTDAADDVARGVMQNILRGLGEQLGQRRGGRRGDYRGPRVLLTHCMLNGARTSNGQPLVGAELAVGLEDLALAQADITITAHIHCPQEHSFGDQDFIYTGSPYRTAFGEVEEKSILMVEIDETDCAWSRIPTPATRMVLVDAEWRRDGGFVFSDPLDVRGAEVRLRYEVDAEARDAARRGVAIVQDGMLDAGGALSVKVEEQVRATVRARAPEVARAQTLEEKLTAYWAARKIEMPAARAKRVLGKLRELEASHGT